MLSQIGKASLLSPNSGLPSSIHGVSAPD
jgi:hypothetical protein